MSYQSILEKQDIYWNAKDKLNIDVKENHEKAFEIEFTHNSTAIEGNTLTLLETKVLLEDGISIGGKKLREIYEVVNHHKAFEYVKKCVAEAIPLDEKILKDIHSIVNENILIGGIYRNEPVRIVGANHKPPLGQKMFQQVKNFFLDLPYKNEMNPMELAAWTHGEFVKIHPFVDGNGRTSRLIMNYQLMINDYPPVSISVKDRLNYYECLDDYAVTGNLTPFTSLIEELVEDRLDEYIEMIQSMKLEASPLELKL